MNRKRQMLWLVGLIVLAALGFVAANVVDYIRFHQAVARVERLTESDFLALADYCRTVKLGEHGEVIPIPPAFQPLKPIRVTPYRGGFNALLYKAGQVCLAVNISSSPSNQQVIYFTYSSGPPKSKVIWNRNQEFARRVSPSRRLVTATQWGMHGGGSWIVLNDRICVVDHSGGEDTLLANAPLDEQGRSLIVAALRSIGPSVRGRDYRTDDVIDGISLHICFTPTGEDGPDDIVISNTWIDAAGPLLDAISKLGPKEFPIRFEKVITSTDWFRKYPTTVLTLKEREKLDSPPPETPWWCVWRSIFRDRG
jgi:hypothetical protein